MRVLLVNDLPVSSGSGTEVHVGRLRDVLAQAGLEVEMFAPEAPRHGWHKATDLWDPVSRQRLRRCGELFAPDVVHFHNITRELSVSVLGAAPGWPSVMTVHDHRLVDGTDRPSSRSRPGEIARRCKTAFDRLVIRRRLDLFIAVSDPLAVRLRERGFEDVRVIPPFAPDPPTPGGPPSSSATITYVGRLAREKGVDHLILAMGRLAVDHPAAELRVVGDGPDATRLHSLVAREHIRNASLEGQAESQAIPAILAASRATCIPSTGPEGSPLAAIEAMAAGRAIVAPDQPAFRALFAGGDAGLLVAPGDRDALEAALRRLLDDGDLADRLGVASRRVYETNHTPAHALAAHLDAYHDAIALHG